MKLHLNNKQLNLLDSFLLPDFVAVKVYAISNIEKIQSQYFIRKKSFRKIYYYTREIGILNVLLKVVSRLREKIRNDKYFSIGIGKIVKTHSTIFKTDKWVYFIACNHSSCPERVVVHEQFIFSPVSSHLIHQFSDTQIAWFSNERCNEPWYKVFLAWSPFSGSPVPVVNEDIKNKIQSYWSNALINSANSIHLQQTQFSDMQCSKQCFSYGNKKSAVLFGLGNYAKTILLPNLHNDIVVTTIHEIDPTQLVPMHSSLNYDSSPLLRENEKYDILFIAGYHHTHADLAISGLSKNADVVVEKPIVTNRQALKNLINAMNASSAELYPCFQRRYHRFNQYLFDDFEIKLGDPISYYAIVYEEVLPQYHWYCWPNSRSSIISNGCHWIDHFMFLNNYADVVSARAWKTKNNEVVVMVELANNATLSLTVSHDGSARIGMQDYIELRSRDATAKIINGSRYFSENSSCIIRKATTNKFEAFKIMYQTISKNIVDKCAPRLSDSSEKVGRVSNLVLQLDECIS